MIASNVTSWHNCPCLRVCVSVVQKCFEYLLQSLAKLCIIPQSFPSHPERQKFMKTMIGSYFRASGYAHRGF